MTSPGINEHVLTRGGEPLSSPVRTFYEGRFGRDFRDVRVHTGPIAERFNDQLNAYAFTYGHHIWLGRGQHARVSELMAHELAHVVQQQRPARLRLKARLPQTLVQDDQPIVRRLTIFEPYWEPYDTSGTKTHNWVLKNMGPAKIFTEAPVPNAKRSLHGYGRSDYFDTKGQVDFYKGSTTVGVYFAGHAKPKNLTADLVPNTVRKNGEVFHQNIHARPKVEGNALVGSSQAPTEIEIGELKPAFWSVPAAVGMPQLADYKAGFELAHREANDPATPGDGASWGNLSVGYMNPTAFTVPEMFTYPTFKGQDAQVLVVKSGLKSVRPMSPKAQYKGHLQVHAGEPGTGVWNYLWIPEKKVDPAHLPDKVQKLPAEIQDRLIDKILQSPLEDPKSPPTVKKKSRSGPPPPAPPTPEEGPIVRRKDIATAPEKDHFEYDEWKKSHQDISDRFEQEKGTQEFKDLEEQVLVNKAYEATRKRSGLSEAELGAVEGEKKSEHELGQVKFWSGKGGSILGYLRKLFGPAFVTVAKFFIKLRDKVRGFLKKLKGGGSAGGFAVPRSGPSSGAS